MNSSIENPSGKVAFVTGAGGGIGRATALAFAEQGVDVAVIGRTQESIEETADLVQQRGVRALAVQVDVSEASEVERAVTTVTEQLGRLDFAFNNAGIEGAGGAAAEADIEDWDRVIATDLSGTFYCMKFQLPHMLDAGGGSIVNVSSGAGVRGFPASPAYVAAKHGVIGLTRATALDYADKNVRVNAIAPGIIDTDMRHRSFGPGQEGYDTAATQEPVGRLGRPEEIAAAAVWLCTADTGFVIGHTLVVDGGQTV